jgi:hypothetical protein
MQFKLPAPITYHYLLRGYVFVLTILLAVMILAALILPGCGDDKKNITHQTTTVLSQANTAKATLTRMSSGVGAAIIAIAEAQYDKAITHLEEVKADITSLDKGVDQITRSSQSIEKSLPGIKNEEHWYQNGWLWGLISLPILGLFLLWSGLMPFAIEILMLVGSKVRSIVGYFTGLIRTTRTKAKAAVAFHPWDAAQALKAKRSTKKGDNK